MSKVKIVSGMHPKTTKIFLDGQRVEDAVSLRLDMHVDNVPRANIEIYMRDTDVEVDALAELTTEIKGVKYKLVPIE